MTKLHIFTTANIHFTGTTPVTIVDCESLVNLNMQRNLKKNHLNNNYTIGSIPNEDVEGNEWLKEFMRVKDLEKAKLFYVTSNNKRNNDMKNISKFNLLDFTHSKRILNNMSSIFLKSVYIIIHRIYVILSICVQVLDTQYFMSKKYLGNFTTATTKLTSSISSKFLNSCLHLHVCIKFQVRKYYIQITNIYIKKILVMIVDLTKMISNTFNKAKPY